ncbi:hypothetical protein GMORB2_7238 [Geosmithia morbida]|uniref:WSC domain-containing protein n=1 Tax=Geosmithia morbida TaxID=1094350 RepID=A0A9P4YV28_9HYPO|nr:uncharacterized protein GMORB2_7238 [Geosmithia morbida]KAF4122246.1 hypothetical protein GMORB2_7238 [Geosmithia morbida]
MTSRIGAILLVLGLAAACDIPGTPLGDNITEGFGILVQSPDYEVVNNRFLNLWSAGGGDQHLYLSPAGDSVFDLVLNQGFLQTGALTAVINGEYELADNTTKMFMTSRGDPRAVFKPTYRCDPDTDDLQVMLAFSMRQESPAGGHICVRSASDNRYEFRYSPPNNPAFTPDRPCMPVTMIVDRSGAGSSPTGSATRTSTTVSATATATSVPDAFTDLTEEGFAFIGCAPEERRVEDGLGRTLTDAVLYNDTMTNEICVKYCASQSLKYAGTEYSRECWCGNSYPPTREPETTVESLSSCNFQCGGDASEICGGDSWLSLYESCGDASSCTNAKFI